MDFQQDGFRERRGPTEVYTWMGWLYTVVGCFIVALLVLMFLDMSNNQQRQAWERQEQLAPGSSNFITPQ